MESSAIQQFVSTEGNYVSKCKFSREFLHPRYWLTWFGLGVLWLWVQLPYPVLCFLGTRIGTMARPFLKRRESIARKNTELCFPQHSAEEREKMIAENFRSLGMALVETAWRGSGPTVAYVNGLMWKGWITLNAHKCKIAA